MKRICLTIKFQNDPVTYKRISKFKQRKRLHEQLTRRGYVQQSENTYQGTKWPHDGLLTIIENANVKDFRHSPIYE